MISLFQKLSETVGAVEWGIGLEIVAAQLVDGDVDHQSGRVFNLLLCQPFQMKTQHRQQCDV